MPGTRWLFSRRLGMSYIDPSVTLLRLRDVPSGDSLAGVPSASCSDVSIVDHQFMQKNGAKQDE